MTRTFYSNVTSPEDPESDSEPEVDEPSVPMRPDTSGEGEEMDLDLGNEVDMGGPSTESADGESNAGGVGKPPRKRGSYMKDGPTVYKLVKPVLKAIKEAKSLELA